MTQPLAWRIGVTVFLLNLPYLSSYLGDPMATSVLDLTVSLVDRGQVNIDPYAGNSVDAASKGGHYYSGMAPGLSIVAAPYYLAAKPWLPLVCAPERERQLDQATLRAGVSWRPSAKRCTILVLGVLLCAFGSAVLAGAMAVMFYQALTRCYPDLAPRTRLTTTWLFSFGTLYFVYSPSLEHRVFSTALCFAAFLLFLHDDGTKARRRSAFLSGLALGFAVATTYEIALVAVCVMAFGLARQGRRWPWGWTITGGLACLLPLAAYHTACFGAPWATPYGARAFRTSAPAAFLNPLWRIKHPDPERELDRAINLLIGRRYGFFFYSPILLLALPALTRLRRGDPMRGPAALGFAIAGLLLLFHFVTGYDGTAGEFGSRFLLPAIPFLMLLVPLSGRWSYRVAVPVLAACSLVVLGKGVMFGAARDLTFWTNYPALLSRYGFANYTLTNLKDHVFPDLSPVAVTAIHAAVLGSILLIVRFLVWRKRAIASQHG